MCSTCAKIAKVQFYITFKDEKVSTLSTQLTYSHYVELLSINDENKFFYYTYACIKRKLSIREARDLIKSNEYERLDEDTKTKPINKENVVLKDMVPNPILTKNTRNVNVCKINKTINNSLFIIKKICYN